MHQWALRAGDADRHIFFTALAAAQSYPAKPIRLLVPFPPGAGADVVARTLAQKVTED